MSLHSYQYYIIQQYVHERFKILLTSVNISITKVRKTAVQCLAVCLTVNLCDRSK